MPLSDTVLRERLATQPWTAYNIRLTPAVTTIPGTPEFLRTDRRLLGILRTLAVLYRGELTGLRIADLGCLEGGFALALAQRGARVLAVDGRQANLDKVRLLIEHFELANLEVACADVKAFTRERYGDFDVVLCLGLLYHLDRPVAWLQQVAATTRAVLVVDTHIAPDDDAIVDLDPRLRRLGPLERREDNGSIVAGRWFQEVEAGVDRAQQEWAAFSNDASFWLTPASLIDALQRAGFDSIFQQQDWIADAYEIYTRKQARLILVAIRSSAFCQEPALALPATVEAPAGEPVPAGSPPPTAPAPGGLWRSLRALDGAIQTYLLRHRLPGGLTRYSRFRSRARRLLSRRR